MAEAMKKAGLRGEHGKQNRPVQRRSKPKTPTHPQAISKSDELDAFKRAMEGVAPLAQSDAGQRSVLVEKTGSGQRVSRKPRTFLRRKLSRPASAGDKPRDTKKPGQPRPLQKQPALPPKAEEAPRNETLAISAKTTVNDAALADDAQNLYDSTLLGQNRFQGRTASAGEVELVVGLDFGTTYCKAVVQEPGSGRAWAIPFSDTNATRYLLATKVRTTDTGLRLEGAGQMTGNLKVPLLQRKMPPRHAVNVIGFLTLVVRHIKAWVRTNKGDELGDVDILWSYHLGLPSKNRQDKRLVSIFEKLLWSAALLAEQHGEEVMITDIERCLGYVMKAAAGERGAVAFPGFGEVYKDQVAVCPEITAQVTGYLNSDRWDRSERRFLLVDIGGGTIDAAVFHVGDEDGDLRFGLLGAAVERLGVYILHRTRLEWLIDRLQETEGASLITRALSEALANNHMPEIVTGHVEDYLTDAHYPGNTVDSNFYEDFRRMLWDDLLRPVKGTTNPGDTQWQNLPYLLCGGGREVALYRHFAKNINAPSSSTQVRLREIEMGVPENLLGPGIDAALYQRLSVAYGLSFSTCGLFYQPKGPSPGPVSRSPSFRDRYVGSEMT